MIGKVKTIKIITFVCCKCGFSIEIDADTIIEAERIAKSLGWTENKNKQAVCAECCCDDEDLSMGKKTIEVDYLIGEQVYIIGYLGNKYIPLKAKIAGYNLMADKIGKVRTEEYWVDGKTPSGNRFYEPKKKEKIFSTFEDAECYIKLSMYNKQEDA